jgi:uncharacterized Zn-finger protein
MSMDEFLKMNKKQPTVVVKKNTAAAQLGEEPKNKKPKFNLILQTTPQKQQKVTVSPTKTLGTSTLNTPTKPQIQIHNIEKILPAQNQATPTKQLVLPIMVRNDGTRNADTAQLLSQAFSMNQTNIENKQHGNQPFYLQLKLPQSSDGQLTFSPASGMPAQQHLQLSLSPQQLQQLSFAAPSQQQAIQPQITVTQIPTQDQADSQTQTPVQTLKNDSQDDDDHFDNNDEDYFFMENDNNDSIENESQEKETTKPSITIVKKRPIKPAKKVKVEEEDEDEDDDDLTELQVVNKEHSETAKKQLNQLTSLNTKRAETENVEKQPDLNLTVCDVCKKIFKRKEFLMQHLKSHIGLRPFKCDEPTCNKSFSRKEHLLRHVVSHTGKKQFTCDVCKKHFSRKDNLNKHRR